MPHPWMKVAITDILSTDEFQSVVAIVKLLYITIINRLLSVIVIYGFLSVI